MRDKLTIGNRRCQCFARIWLINNGNDIKDTRTQVRQVCIVQALVRGGIKGTVFVADLII